MITVVNKYKHTPTENDVYIGRGSVLGNPFTSITDRTTKAEFISDNPIEDFEKYLNDKITKKDKKICYELNRIYKMNKVNLVCFCKPKACHGDVIKRVIENKIKECNEKIF
jgi:hypothetical protein